MTNRCPCSCTFCLRHNKDHVFNADSLWLEREPSVKEVCDSIDAWDLSQYDEVVFCGYGEPMERLDALLEILGHSDISETLIYAHVLEESKLEGIRCFDRFMI